MISTTKIVLLVDLNGHHSHHAKLLTYIKKQVNAPICQLDCYICVSHKEFFDIQHPLIAFILSMPMLEQVKFLGLGGKATINVFLDAVIQNDSIDTIQLNSIKCLAHVVQKFV